jgi:hypothetical protein
MQQAFHNSLWSGKDRGHGRTRKPKRPVVGFAGTRVFLQSRVVQTPPGMTRGSTVGSPVSEPKNTDLSVVGSSRDQFNPAPHRQLPVNVTQVCFDGMPGKVECSGNLVIAKTFEHPFDNLPLSRSQHLE